MHRRRLKIGRQARSSLSDSMIRPRSAVQVQYTVDAECPRDFDMGAVWGKRNPVFLNAKY